MSLQLAKPKPTHIYNTRSWKEARKKALERDKYICQVCGLTETKGRLEVNHILPYRIIESHEEANLVTLCKKHHARMDWMIRDLLNLSPTKKRFLEILGKMWLTNLRKSHDYATDIDDLSNFKRAKKLGLTPFQGILVRLGDKFSRIEELSKKEAAVVGEGIKDTLIDIAVYSLLARILLEEEAKI